MTIFQMVTWTQLNANNVRIFCKIRLNKINHKSVKLNQFKSKNLVLIPTRASEQEGPVNASIPSSSTANTTATASASAKQQQQKVEKNPPKNSRLQQVLFGCQWDNTGASTKCQQQQQQHGQIGPKVIFNPDFVSKQFIADNFVFPLLFVNHYAKSKIQNI